MITESMREIKARVDGGGTAGERGGLCPRAPTRELSSVAQFRGNSVAARLAFLRNAVSAAARRTSSTPSPCLLALRENAAPLINVLPPGLRRTFHIGIYIIMDSTRPRYCAKMRRDFPRRFAPSFLHRELERAAALSKFQSYPAACTPGAVAAAGELAPPSARIQAVAVVSEMNFRTSPTPTYFSALPSFITTSVGACLTPSSVASSAFSLASSFL